ncbi:MAG: hypothetical protein IT376_17070 [Polyangiaceae bacterium]|nr:hypothetical protein [Polyangiaceae bacterium]
MTRARWRRAGGALATAAATLAPPARGAGVAPAPWVVPSASGTLGVWRAVGRDRAGPSRILVARAPEAAEVGAPALLDLDAARPGAPVGAELTLELELRVPARADAWLLLAGETAARVELGERLIADRVLTGARAAAWSAAPLALAAGTHRLRVLARRTERREWALGVRVVDRAVSSVPAGLTTSTGSAAGVSSAERWAPALTTTRLSVAYEAGVVVPVLGVLHAAGALDSPALAASGSIGGREVFRVRLGRAPSELGGVHPVVATLPVLDAATLGDEPRALRVELRAGGRTTSAELAVSGAAIRAHDAALAAERGAPAEANAATRATLAWRRSELVLSRTAVELRRATAALAAATAAQRGGPSWLHAPGLRRLALPSPVDGAPDPVVVHVPRGHTPERRAPRPLVLLLHGYDGTPESVLRAFLDSTDEGPHPAVDGFVVAPSAHGNAFYRGPGEAAAMAALDWAMSTYPIDRDRVSVAGVSMGGTGAAHLALRYPGTFAAASPLCGYQSWFVRRDTQGVELRPWERARLHSWSPASWAESGRHVPLFVAHGLQDLPLENSRVLVDRYRALGAPITDSWPDTGHSVWLNAWDDAAGWPWLTRHQRAAAPRRVTLATDALRYGALHWVRLTALAPGGGMARVDARITGPGRIEVATVGVDALELEPPAALVGGGAARVVVDGTELEATLPEIALARRAGAWALGRPDVATRKRAALEGPIGDAWLGALTVAWGSGSAATARANRELAETLARWPRGARVTLPVLRDVDLPPELESRSGIVAVGTPGDHSLLASVADRLALRWAGDHLAVGGARLDGPGTGAIFVQPNPRAPSRYLVVVTAVDAAGIWRAASLPTHLPDFLVYDDALGPAAGRHVLGSAGVRAGGFFLADWSAPPDSADLRTAPGP